MLQLKSIDITAQFIAEPEMLEERKSVLSDENVDIGIMTQLMDGFVSSLSKIN